MILATHLSLTEERSPEGLVVHAKGEVDASTASQFAGALSKAADVPDGDLIVDLSRVEFMDVKGFAALLNAQRKAADAQRQMTVVCPPSGQVRRLLGVLDTSGRLSLVP
jgi:anti-anti-sigma factor